MEFPMKDFETAIAVNANGAVNVQGKKQFEPADVDSNEIRLENDDWNIDSIFPLNNDFLNDLGDINIDANWADAYDYMSSPISTGTESENDHDMLGMKPLTNQMLSPPQNLISSSSSDSGLSSDHIDFDMNFDQLSTDLLQQPLLSTQIIPELFDQEPAQSPVSLKQNVEPEIIMMTQQQNVSEKVEIRDVPEATAKLTNAAVAQIKNSDNLQKSRVQIIKKIPPNIVQITDPHGKIKLNQARISENIISNNPIVINKFNGNISSIRKVIQLKKSPNQKPIILPFTLKNGTDIRSIKIIKPSSLTKSPKILMAASNLLQEYRQNEMKQNAIILNKQIKVEPKYENDSMSEPSDCESYKFEDMIVQDDDGDDVDDYNNDSDQGVEVDQQSEYPKLVLSGEEKRLLAKEGIKLPAHYPLTKQEERELKRIRRKIRNKISAQDSRKRKKEYVDGLEERVKKCTDENQTLLHRIRLLQTQNQNLINQMKKMQNLLTKGGNKSVQPATCLMVLLMSMALIAAPNLKLNNKDNNTDEALLQELQMENHDIQQNRRALLYDSKEKFSDMVADEEMGNDFNMLYDKSENEHNYAETQTKLSSNKIDQLIDFDIDDSVWEPKVNTSRDKITPKNQSLLKNGDSIGADHVMSYDFNQFGDMSEPTVTHAKSAKNLSDLPSNVEYRLKLANDDITNIIDLNTEIDAKNV